MIDDVKDRGTGRTTRMLQSITQDYAIVIVHRQRDTYQVKAMIDKHLPKNPDRHFSIIAIETERDCDKLRGTSLPIYIDHLFTERAPEELRKAVEYFQARAAARQ